MGAAPIMDMVDGLEEPVKYPADHRFVRRPGTALVEPSLYQRGPGTGSHLGKEIHVLAFQVAEGIEERVGDIHLRIWHVTVQLDHGDDGLRMVVDFDQANDVDVGILNQGMDDGLQGCDVVHADVRSSRIGRDHINGRQGDDFLVPDLVPRLEFDGEMVVGPIWSAGQASGGPGRAKTLRRSVVTMGRKRKSFTDLRIPRKRRSRTVRGRADISRAIGHRSSGRPTASD